VKFFRCALRSAKGLTLAHSIPLGRKAIKKGTMLTAEHILALTNAGIEDAMVVKFDDDDMHENNAAETITKSIISQDIRLSKASTGRVNIYATSAGLFKANLGAINRLNSLNDGITLSTITINKVVSEGDMIATLKIIPYALPKSVVSKAVSQVKEVPLFFLAKWKNYTPLLITTHLKEPNLDLNNKILSTLNQRLQRLGNSVGMMETSKHHEGYLSKVIKMGLETDHNLLFIVGASATQDIKDVVPAAIQLAGGTVTRFGMPVDPGNLLLVGYLGKMLIIGLPGCAKSLQKNGFDWVLERIIAGETITDDIVNRLGVGGLLKEPPSRPSPREGQRENLKQSGNETNKLPSAIVLAAGLSKRMGGGNKLLEEVKGKAVIRHTVENILASGINNIKVVLGKNAEEVKQALAGLNVSFIINPTYQDGQSTSIREGINALSDDTCSTFIVLGDMPSIKPETFSSLSSTLDPTKGILVVAPEYQGKRGNPVLWHGTYFDQLKKLTGDQGAKEVLLQSPEAVKIIDCNDPGVLIDLDTKAAFKAFE
jgi:molybdenum cofactor cytidylyltransferase